MKNELIAFCAHFISLIMNVTELLTIGCIFLAACTNAWPPSFARHLTISLFNTNVTYGEGRGCGKRQFKFTHILTRKPFALPHVVAIIFDLLTTCSLNLFVFFHAFRMEPVTVSHKVTALSRPSSFIFKDLDARPITLFISCPSFSCSLTLL